jgi:hypothetical protein
MKFILIMVVFGIGRPAATNVEFNTKAACTDAAKEVQRQGRGSVGMVLCAEKGKEP